MPEIYEKVILWSDIMIVSTPIRWGNASSLSYLNGSKDEFVQNESLLIISILLEIKLLIL